MKFAILPPFAALVLVLMGPAGAAQSPEAPGTERARTLEPGAKPRERPAPADDGRATEEPDDEDADLGEALRGAEPPASRPR